MASLTLGGLVNGIDFNSLVDALVQLEQIPITQIEDKQTRLNNRRD
ncbi:MAG: hypothetical protein HYU66_21410, partial [Armatimonadetes bacterium]|nr:hypothetical protein [Armatimonadota bacterium]